MANAKPQAIDSPRGRVGRAALPRTRRVWEFRADKDTLERNALRLSPRNRI